jgi:hypothetical protein
MTHVTLAHVDEHFVRPPHLPMSCPRPVELTAAGRAVIGAAMLCFLGAATLGPLLYHHARREAVAWRAFLDRSRVVAGEVVRVRSGDDEGGRIEYRFLLGTAWRDGRGNLSPERRRGLRPGAPIEVRYLPDDPNVHRLNGARYSGLPVPVSFVVSVGLALAGAACLILVARQRWLLSEGRVAPGIVTSRKSHKSSHETKSERVQYEFALLNGSTATGKATFHKSPPAVGSVVCVLYDPERPGRSAVYPFSFVRPTP